MIRLSWQFANLGIRFINWMLFGLALFVFEAQDVLDIRILAFATMLHQGWATRPAADVREVPVPYEAACAEPVH